ncbi:MAG: hypothetical protein E7353_06040 [Clostridiales bacterium]|nr:hypothetical protein [Clostridiales bacterium]
MLKEKIMSFLYCNPNVLVVKNNYEIIVNVLEHGVCYVQVGKKKYYANNTGIMPSVNLVQKFLIPQKQLDAHKKYTVCYKRVYERKSYFPEIGEWECKEYSFKPIEKDDNVNMIYTADIHGKYEDAKKPAGYFGNDMDLFVVNGDFGESDSYENLRLLSKFIGDVTGGNVPALVGRGNHDTRGPLAEKVTDYMATYDGRAYFDFTIGPLSGVVLDCGEDKLDNHDEYRGLNFFEQYRRDELAFLKKLKLADRTFKFAVCHVPFMSVRGMGNGGPFDIMPETYKAWGKEIDRLGIEFMICGHQHELDYVGIVDKRNKFPHSYPVIVGANIHGGMVCSAVTFKKSGTTVKFVHESGKILREFTVKDGYER